MSKKTVVKRVLSILLMALVILGTMPIQGDAVFAELEIPSPDVTWVGKTIKWEPVEGATGYKVILGNPAPDSTTETTVDASVTTMDFTDYINEHGAGRYVANVYTLIDDKTSRAGSGEKFFSFVSIKVYYNTYADSTSYREGTTGGTVSVTTTSGELLSGPDEKGAYQGLLEQTNTEEGNKVTITASSAEGYSLKEFCLGNDTVSEESPYTFKIQGDETTYDIGAYFIVDERDPITATLKWSSLDGATPVDDLEVSVPYGTSLSDLLEDDLDSIWNHFQATGYAPLGEEEMLFTEGEISDYTDIGDAEEASMFETALTEDTTIYVLMGMEATQGSFTVAKPICGAEVNCDFDLYVQTNHPQMTVEEESQFEYSGDFPYDPVWWIDLGEPVVPLDSVTLIGGESYTAAAMLVPKFGYAIGATKPTFTIENADAGSDSFNKTQGLLTFTVTADHNWQFQDITWSPADGGGYTAKANYVCQESDESKKSVDCVVTEEELDGKGTKYTATVSADDSLDGEEHSDTKTVYNVYNLYVQGRHVTGDIQDDILGDGTVKYNPKTNTLTLNNATIEASRRNYGDDGMEYGIRANLPNADANVLGATAVEGPLTIELIGENTINNATTSEGTTKVFGIANVSQTKLTFTGGGSLNINMNASEIDSYTGIEVRNALAFDGAVVNVNMEGSKPTRGIEVIYSNTVKLSNGAEVHIKTGRHTDTYAFYNNRNNKDLTVGEDCIFEAVSENLAFHQIDLTDETKSLGALVNTKETMYGAELWDGETDLNTYKYVRIPTIRLTIHWSSIDGEDLMDPIKIGVTPGTRIQESVKILDPKNVYGAYYPFEMEGYDAGFIIFVDQPLSAFTDSTPSSIDDDVSEHSYGGNEEIYDDMDVYFIMFKAVGVEPTIALKAPVCGTEVVTETGVVDTQTNRPEFTIKEDEHYAIPEDDEYMCSHYWSADEDDSDYFSGTMEGGEAYYAVIYLEPYIGYYFDKDVTEVTGADEIINSWNNDSWIRVMVSVKAVHDMEEHEGTEATCTEEGNKPYNVCKGCDKWFVDSEGETEITNHDEVIIPALDHDWGEWTETKAPTTEAEGEETRTCSRCDKKETRSIPKIDPENINYRNVDGDGGTWTKGSKESLSFTFKRNVNDEMTFDEFVKAQVDGVDLKEGQYKSSAGSLIIELLPSYLETLSAGEHTLTAVFADGNNPTAKFTINGDTPSADPSDEPTDDPADEPTDDEVNPADDDKAPTDSQDNGQAEKKSDKQSDKKDSKKKAANTGDESNPTIWIIFIAAGAAIIGGLVSMKKRK